MKYLNSLTSPLALVIHAVIISILPVIYQDINLPIVGEKYVTALQPLAISLAVGAFLKWHKTD